jgi:hypothetical protein
VLIFNYTTGPPTGSLVNFNFLEKKRLRVAWSEVIKVLGNDFYPWGFHCLLRRRAPTEKTQQQTKILGSLSRSVCSRRKRLYHQRAQGVISVSVFLRNPNICWLRIWSKTNGKLNSNLVAAPRCERSAPWRSKGGSLKACGDETIWPNEWSRETCAVIF